MKPSARRLILIFALFGFTSLMLSLGLAYVNRVKLLEWGVNRITHPMGLQARIESFDWPVVDFQIFILSENLEGPGIRMIVEDVQVFPLKWQLRFAPNSQDWEWPRHELMIHQWEAQVDSHEKAWLKAEFSLGNDRFVLVGGWEDDLEIQLKSLAPLKRPKWGLEADFLEISLKMPKHSIPVRPEIEAATIQFGLRSTHWKGVWNHEVRVQGRFDSVTKSLQSEIHARDLNQIYKLSSKWHGKPSEILNGEFELVSDLVNLEKSLATLFPKWRKKLSRADGKLKVSGSSSVSPRGLEALRAQLTGNVKRLTIHEVPFEDVWPEVNVAYAGTFYLDGIQRLRIRKLGEQLPIENIQAELRSDLKSARLLRLDGDWSGGRWLVKPFSTLWSRPRVKTEILINGIQLADLLSSFKAAQVTGRGKLDGSIPVRWDGQELFIDGSYLKAREPGRIRYRDPTIQDIPRRIGDLKAFGRLIERGQQALVFKALDNFYYEKLAIHLSRRRAGDLRVTLELSGKNPDLIKGQAFQMKIPFRGRTEALLIDSFFKPMVDEASWSRYTQEGLRMKR